jgi:hypothetical protein
MNGTAPRLRFPEGPYFAVCAGVHEPQLRPSAWIECQRPVRSVRF